MQTVDIALSLPYSWKWVTWLVKVTIIPLSPATYKHFKMAAACNVINVTMVAMEIN